MSLTPSMAQTDSRVRDLTTSAVAGGQKDQLLTYLQNKIVQLTTQGNVGSPEYIIIAGQIQALKNADAKAQMAPPNERSVISDLLPAPLTPQAAPQVAPAPEDAGGIAAMDAPNMETIDMMSGGLVAFGDGGEVPRYQNQGFVGPTKPSREALAWRMAQEKLPPIGGVKTPPTAGGRGLFGRALGPLSLVYDELFATSDEDVNRLKALDEAKTVLKQQGLSDQDIGNLSTKDIFSAAQSYGYQGQQGLPAKIAPKGLDAAEKALAAQAAQIDAGQGPNAQKGLSALEGNARSGRVPGLSEETIAGLDALKARNEKSDEEKAIAAAKSRVDQLIKTPEALDVNKVKEEREKFYESMGVAKDPYAFAQEDYDKAKEQLSLRRGERGWEAGLEAGLAMLGGESPYALVNIGKAGTQALKSWSADKKEMDKLDRELLKEKRSLDIAKNNYNKSMADSDLAKVEKRQEKIDSINMEKAKLQIGLDVELAKAAGLKEYRADEGDRALLKAAQTTAASMLEKKFAMNPNITPAEQARQVSQLAAQLYNAQKEKYKNAGPSAVPSGVKVTKQSS